MFKDEIFVGRLFDFIQRDAMPDALAIYREVNTNDEIQSMFQPLVYEKVWIIIRPFECF